ncbi:MAG TPA: sigma 54-interacting transcriptional regulator [Desulfosporosinus sp.]|nr:sigma 54-interacting transcriptional regulator [Desulfosporosinus sp.]
MSKHRIVIVAADEKVSREYKSQLQGIFGSKIEIELLSLEDDTEIFLGFDLILAASQAIYEDVKKKAPLNAKIISVIRNINTLELQKVFNIEPGSTALVVSNYFDAAQETVALLTELGLNHIKYIPYCPGCVLDPSLLNSVNLAITAGASDFVPIGIHRIVDLGLKVIDISTVVEIIINLGLSLERINVFTLRYMKEFIALNRKISDLKYRLEAVLDASSDGIISLDLLGNIVFLNQNAETFLSPLKPINIGANIEEYTTNPLLLQFVMSVDERDHDVFKLNKRDVIISKNYLKSAAKITGTVVSFRYVSELMDIEKQVRRKLSSTGNIAKYDLSDIIGSSKRIRTAIDMTLKIARTDLSVLLLGENGTGKELFGQSIHRNSARREGPFVAVNFAALPENLIESELFGYEEGAFTGAKRGGKLGLFELAHKGTIFLDEIGDAPLSMQARLLRVIQEKEVLRVGGVSPIPIDVRVIAATNKNLKNMIEDNLFRKDLYYRINTITLCIPALRERKEDILDIINYYLDALHARKTFSSQSLHVLMEYNWPGNVRELQNLIYYVAELVDSDLIEVDDLPQDFYPEHHLPHSIQGDLQKGKEAPPFRFYRDLFGAIWRFSNLQLRSKGTSYD